MSISTAVEKLKKRYTERKKATRQSSFVLYYSNNSPFRSGVTQKSSCGLEDKMRKWKKWIVSSWFAVKGAEIRSYDFKVMEVRETIFGFFETVYNKINA